MEKEDFEYDNNKINCKYIENEIDLSQVNQNVFVYNYLIYLYIEKTKNYIYKYKIKYFLLFNYTK